MLIMQNRRRFLAGAAAVTAAGLVGAPKRASAEPPPETTTVRLPKLFRSVCLAPQNIAGELLRAEGFTDVRYIEIPIEQTPSRCSQAASWTSYRTSRRRTSPRSTPACG